MKKSQCERLQAHLKRHGRIDPMTALRRYGIYRLSGRILELRQRGLNIVTDKRKGSQMAIYRLA